jgi:hypothetical protein
MVVAGLRFDTSMRTPIALTARKSSGSTRRSAVYLTSRWSSKMRPSTGYTIRHPLGF